MNRRRELVIALGAGALVSPLGSFAQRQGKVWRVGFLSQRERQGSPDEDQYRAFPLAMRELGYAEGRNLVVEWRFADGVVERLPGLAAELVGRKVDVIVSSGTPATIAVQKATTTIPIVMSGVGDPVASGIVTNLARPTGNITGLTTVTLDSGPKKLGMLVEMVPNLSRVAVLVNPDNPNEAAFLTSLRRAAQTSKVTIVPVEARTLQGIDEAFSAMAQQKAEALVVAGDGYLNQQYRHIAEMATKHRLPAISAQCQFVVAGFLMCYGPNTADSYRRVATYVDKILRGAKPGDLPIEQPTEFEFAINAKTAKALGLAIPQALLLRADEVIR